MEVEHMNGGLGETSYAKNSSLQRVVISKVKPILEESVTEVCCSVFPECLRIADLGCSSGPNSLEVVSNILDIVDATCRRLNRKPPVFQVFLNDPPGNDFNTLFQSLPSFYDSLKKVKGSEFGTCFVAGMPGNFYGRLFPNNFMHIIHSSYSLHWLRQVPKGLVSKEGEGLNKESICISKTCPHEILRAYLDEFQQGFAIFLRCRSQELVADGSMVITLMGRVEHPKNIVEELGRALHDMVLEGIVEEEKFVHFNLPYYLPSIAEVKNVIDEEGSFSLQKLDVFETDIDAGFDEPSSNHRCDGAKQKRAQYVCDVIRAVMEPMFVKTFGEIIMDSLFERFTVKIVEAMAKEPWPYVNLIFSLRKKKIA